MAQFNHNPTGKNQHGEKLKADDPVLKEALEKYHHERLTDSKKIAKRLAAEYQIHMSWYTVRRRRKELGLMGSGVTTKALPLHERTQLVVSQMDKDPARHQGKDTIMRKIAFEHGVHLTRDFVSEIMHQHDAEGFEMRNPTAKKIHSSPKRPIGIHERWAGDGHDKLYKIGFPIWAVLDGATGKWLGAWIVPSNHMGNIIAYLFLCLVEKYGGIPLQFTTVCGSETTALHGLVDALRSISHEELDNQQLPADVYLRSVHNITIEHSWLRLRLDFGDNAVTHFNRGLQDGIYNAEDPEQFQLCQWLWSRLLRQELQNFKDFHNAARMRKDKKKPGPSGMSRNEAFSLHEEWGGKNCLVKVDVAVVAEIKATMGGDQILDFVSAEYAHIAQVAYDTLGIVELTFENVWDTFSALLPLVHMDFHSV
ncbi:uncharacterized protein LAESUDRAFT_690342 [Laetiporus sulphureus 93-53]|uniref:Integrase catalytic domain-containing protein n=1 Tax=Laetiporus sulphureus 93-53 TaxID=1314785 RepID=A0A165IIX6_9APHY|nr:uncharacterized protein LAESUDRAFT_690342 [Laetiporus sulphureus 93-53]KZT13141.1 hypothetical protein LAESUDRAFT_690342 [Laetiporus sulphureus 93-53]